MSRRFRAMPVLGAALALLLACTTAAPTPLPATPSPSAPPTTAPAASPTATPPPATIGPTTSPTTDPSPIPTPSRTNPPPTASLSPAGITISADDISAHLDALDAIARQNGDLRAAGLPGYDASADYVAEELESYGYAVERQAFEFDFFDEAEPVTLTIGDASWTGSEWLHAMLYSAPGDVSGELEAVSLEGEFSVGTGGCDASDWVEFTPGRIAVLASGPCFRRDQITLAQDAGAIAVISIYPNWESGQTRRPTLLSPEGITIPAIVAGMEPTFALLDAIADGGTAQIEVATIAEQRTVENVIAEVPGASDRVIMLGGHLDSALDGPGINDNGSGVATLLSMAESLRTLPAPEDTVRFAFWAGEEFGLLGSTTYVAGLAPDELGRIDAYVNLDMVGSPNAARFVYEDELSAEGSSELTRALLDALAELDAPADRYDASGVSDHFPFAQAGIPTGGVFSGLAPLSEQQARLFGGVAGEPADPCYHLSCDTRANISLDSAVLLGQAVANVVEDLAFQP